MGVINLGLLVDKIKRKLEGAGFIKNTDYASASKSGVVKVGSGLEISGSGVLSATAQGGGFSVDKIYDGNGTNITFTFPKGKTISDYNFILVCTDYSGSDHDCITRLIPVAQIVANTSVLSSLWYSSQWYLDFKASATGITYGSTSSGSYKINKVYAF